MSGRSEKVGSVRWGSERVESGGVREGSIRVGSGEFESWE